MGLSNNSSDKLDLGIQYKQLRANLCFTFKSLKNRNKINLSNNLNNIIYHVEMHLRLKAYASENCMILFEMVKSFTFTNIFVVILFWHLEVLQIMDDKLCNVLSLILSLKKLKQMRNNFF